jgi:hypothetical protein
MNRDQSPSLDPGIVLSTVLGFGNPDSIRVQIQDPDQNRQHLQWFFKLVDVVLNKVFIVEITPKQFSRGRWGPPIILNISVVDLDPDPVGSGTYWLVRSDPALPGNLGLFTGVGINHSGSTKLLKKQKRPVIRIPKY